MECSELDAFVPAQQFRACELAGCAPSEAVMVGDNYICDIQGAAEAGIGATVWINEAGKALPANCPVQPTHIVESVTELPGLLGLEILA